MLHSLIHSYQAVATFENFIGQLSHTYTSILALLELIEGDVSE
jgi:hypothetical protein